MNDFAERLKELRKEKGLTQKELANDLGVTQTAINYWERGKREPNLDMVRKIADYFHTSIVYLLDGKEEYKHPPKLISYDEIESKIQDDETPFLLRALDTSLDAILDFTKKALIHPFEGIAQAEIKAIQAFVEYTRKDIDETRRLGNLLSYYQTLDKEERIAFIQLLHIYIKMNDVGKAKLYEYSKDIVKNPDNTKSKQNQLPDDTPQD